MEANSTEILDAANALGSVTDIWVLIVLIIPGFITFRILSWIATYEAKFDQFTTTIYSLICSLIVFLPIAYFHKIEALEQIRIQITNFNVLLEMMGFAVLFGIVPGIILKLTIRQHYKSGSAWDRFAITHKQQFVTVYTNDDKEYIGWIKRMSIGKDEKKEVALGDPKFVKRMKEGIYELKDMGEEMLFTETSIKRILKHNS